MVLMNAEDIRNLDAALQVAHKKTVPLHVWKESTGFDSLTLAVSLGQSAFDSRAARESGGIRPGDGGMTAGKDRQNH